MVRRRVIQVLFIGVAVLGAALLLWPGSEMEGDRLQDDVRSLTPPPGWVHRAPLKEDFVRRIEPVQRTGGGGSSSDEAPTGAATLLEGLETILETLERPAEIEAAGRMQRTLAGGQVFDTTLDLDLRSAGGEGDGRFDLTIHHSPGSWSRYRGTIRSRLLTDLETVAVHGPGAPTFPEAEGDRELAERVPLALGDVHLGDLDGVAGALALGDLDLVGELRSPGAEPLFVFDLRFPHRSTTGEVSEYSTRGETALVHVGVDDHRPRALRVFDRGDRLVRTYSDFTFADTDGTEWPKLRSFRVDSVASRSHTSVTIDRSELTVR